MVESPGQAGGFLRSGGAAIEAVLLLDDQDGTGPQPGVGAALRWFERIGGDADGRLLLLVDPGRSGRLARHAEYFTASGPRVEVRVVTGTTTEAAHAERVSDPPALPPEVWSLAGIINESGARAVDDNGRLVAEVAGLEVARVEPDGPAPVDVDAVMGGDPTDPDEAAVAEALSDYLHERRGEGPWIEVGVGQADRELNELVHAEMPQVESLRRVVALVGGHRRPGANPHPLNRIARQRWLRSIVLDRPSLIGADRLEPVAPLAATRTVMASAPVAATGLRGDGTPLVAVFATGVDLELGCAAADYRERHRDGDTPPELVVVLPKADRYPSVERQIERLRPPVSTISIPSPWEAAETA